MCLFFFSLFIFRRHSTRETASSRVTYFILRAYTGTGVSHSQHRKKSAKILEKMQVNGPEGEKLARKKSLAVSVACMAIYRPTPGFKGRTFKLCVFIRWDFNFCVHSSPLRERYIPSNLAETSACVDPVHGIDAGESFSEILTYTH